MSTISFHPKYILLPGSLSGGYSFGVEAGPSHGGVELHGGFRTREHADRYAKALRDEYSDYEYVKVVKIETPVPS